LKADPFGIKKPDELEELREKNIRIPGMSRKDEIKIKGISVSTRTKQLFNKRYLLDT